MVSAVVTTETQLELEVDVPSGVVSELSVGLKVIGNGFEQGTQIGSIESVPNDPSVYKSDVIEGNESNTQWGYRSLCGASHSDLNKITRLRFTAWSLGL